GIIIRLVRGRRHHAGHSRTTDRPMVVGAARSTLCHREPAGCRRQYRHRAVVRAAADGYTLVLLAVSHAINTTLYDKLKFNLIRDVTPIATLINQPHVMLVNPSVPATTVPEFIAYAKANLGKINIASRHRDRKPLGRRVVPNDDWRQHGARALSRRG